MTYFLLISRDQFSLVMMSVVCPFLSSLYSSCFFLFFSLVFLFIVFLCVFSFVFSVFPFIFSFPFPFSHLVLSIFHYLLFVQLFLSSPISQVFILVLYTDFPSQTFVSNSPFPSSLSFYLPWGTGHLTSAFTASLLFPSLRLPSPAPSLGPACLYLPQPCLLSLLPPHPPRLRFTPHCLRG